MATRKPDHHSDSDLIEKGLPCWRTDCGSSNAVAHYQDTDTGNSRYHCFSCGHTKGAVGGGGAPQQTTHKVDVDVAEYAQQGRPLGIKSRGITQTTAKHWDYRVWEKPNGEYVQLAVYRDGQGTPVGVKVRPDDKDGIHWGAGSAKGNLFGRHLWPAGGKRLVITEGELDAMSLSQAYNHKYPVVSVPNGAAEAAKAITKNLEYILSFDEVVLGFDMDGPGQEAAVACAQLIPAGRVKIVKWPGTKDANDLLVAGKNSEMTWAVQSAEVYRPDGILDARTLTAACLTAPTMGMPWPWPDLTKWTFGRRPGEVYVLGAGYGIGKTDVLAETIACTLKGTIRATNERFQPEGCALFGYESGPVKSKKAIAGKLWMRRFHLPQDDTGFSWTDAELVEALTYMDTEMWDLGGKLFINDNRGHADWGSVKDRCRYLAHAEGVKHVFIDPISALIEEEGENVDERRFLDTMVREAAKLAVELQVSVYLYSHLTRPKEGASHEEGGQVRGSQFRGSNAIGMFADFVFGMERNTQAETVAERAQSTIRVVKDRLSGNYSGETTGLAYDSLHGVLDPGTYEEPAPTFVGDV